MIPEEVLDDRTHDTPPELDPSVPPRLLDLSGATEVQVSGESHHMEALEKIWADDHWGDSYGPMDIVAGHAALIPEPPGDHDCQAVAVYINSRHVGYLPRHIGPRMKAALALVSHQNDSRPIGCTAELRRFRSRPNIIQVVLLLNLQQLGLRYADVEVSTSLATALNDALDKLEAGPPTLSHHEPSLTGPLASATEEANLAESRLSAEARSMVDPLLRDLAERLEAAGDPRAAGAWLLTARNTRYVAGRRDDTIAAFVSGLHLDRNNSEAWCELIEYASLAPHVPTLVRLFGFVPETIRKRPLNWMLAISHGHDQHGRLNEDGGRELRRRLLEVAESDGDIRTLIALLVDMATTAEQAGDDATAKACRRRAANSCRSRPDHAEFYTKILMDGKRYLDAVEVLAPFENDAAISVDDRRKLTKRLNHCRRMVAKS